MNSLRGRVAMVTGSGRRRGIGAAICRALAEKGADVYFTYWNDGESEPEALLEELRGAEVRVETHELDLSLPESPERLLDVNAVRLGSPSILVNNVIYSTRDSYEVLDAATLDAYYVVNLRATALLSVVFTRRFDGDVRRIINLTSGQSLGPMPGELAYAATKGAIEACTRTLAAEVGHKGITANAVNPAVQRTPALAPRT